MMDFSKESQRGVRMYFEPDLNDEFFGVDPSPYLEIMEDDVTKVAVHNIVVGDDRVKHLLDEELNPSRDDGNFGIDSFQNVKKDSTKF